MAPTITNGYEIIADEALSEVFRTALQLPDEFAAADVDRQAEAYETAIDLKDFQDPQKLAAFLDRFTALWEIENSSDSYDPLCRIRFRRAATEFLPTCFSPSTT